MSRMLLGEMPAGFSTTLTKFSEAVLVLRVRLVTWGSAGSSWLMSSRMLSMRGLTGAPRGAPSPPTKGPS